MSDAISAIFAELGIILTDDHFVYTSGRHGACYVNKDALYPHIDAVQTVCAAMAAPFVGKDIDTVVGPTMGGVVLSQWVAASLSEVEKRPVHACFSEEREGDDGEKERYFGRGYPAFVTNKRVLVVEDILTTGGSVKKVVEAVQSIDGNVVAVSALCNRGAVSEEQVGSVPLQSLVTVNFESFPAENCPLCAEGVPVSTRVGKGQCRA